MFLSSPGGTEMFQFPPFAPSYDGDRPSACRVAPFGHSRITSCLRIPVNFRSLPRPSSPPDSLGIPRSPFSSFSRELQSLDAVTRHVQRLSSCLVFAYEIAVPNSQLEKTLELFTNYKLIFFSIFTSYSLSMLSMNCHALTAACAVFLKKTELLIPESLPREVSFPCTPTASSCRISLQKGGVPATPSGTATLLRLSPNYRFRPRTLLSVTYFRRHRLSWLDGRCVQGPGTYSPRHV